MVIKRSATCFSWMIISAILLLEPINVFAQKKLGESVITVGAGLSIIGVASSVSINSGQGTHSMKVSPAYSGYYDIGLADFFSLGIAASSQTFKLSYYYNVYNSSNQSVEVHYTDRLTRNNYGLRALFHFGKNEKIDLYSGSRIGYTLWNISTTNPDPLFEVENNQPWALRVSTKSKIGYTVQGIFGMRVFFNDYIGMCYEISMGAPSFFTLGLNAKF